MTAPENRSSRTEQTISNEPTLKATSPRSTSYTASLRAPDETKRLAMANREELLQEVERQARELKLLHEVRKNLLGVNDLREIYRTAVESIAQVFGFNLVSVYQLAEDELILQAHVGYTQHYERLQVGQGINGQVAMTGRGVFLTDVSKNVNYLSASPDVTGGVYVPLLGPGHEMLGTLSIETDHEHQLEERDYRLCQAVAEQISLAVSQALAYERETRRIAQLTVLNHIGRELALAFDVDTIIERITGPLRESLNFYSVGIGLIEDQKLIFRHVPLPDQPDQIKEYIYKLDQRSLVCHSARTGELVICQDVTAEPRFMFVPELPNTQAEVVVPLRSAGQVIGVLNVESDTKGSFDDDDIILLKTLADQTSIALTNALRFATLQYQSQELNKTNRALAEANRLKSEFLANVSHELRTPLNSIIGYVDMIQSGFYGDIPDEMNDPLERVYRNGRRLLTLINDVLDLANIEAGRMHLLVEEALTSELISSLILANRGAAEEKGLTLDAEIVPGVPRIIQTDIKRVQQIVGIILSNAIKFTHEGHIRVQVGPAALQPDQAAFYIAISDTGIGIPVNEFENIFEEFRQIDGSSTRQYGGTGLGLALGRRLIRQMGGKIDVSSEVGQGSIFTLTLPILPIEQEEEE